MAGSPHLAGFGREGRRKGSGAADSPPSCRAPPCLWWPPPSPSCRLHPSPRPVPLPDLEGRRKHRPPPPPSSSGRSGGGGAIARSSSHAPPSGHGQSAPPPRWEGRGEERWEGRGEERRGGRGLRKLWLRGKRGERFLNMLIFVDGQLSRLTVFIFVGGNLVSRDLPA